MFALKVLGPLFGSLILGTMFQVRQLDFEAEPPIALAAPHARAHKASAGRTAQRPLELVTWWDLDELCYALVHLPSSGWRMRTRTVP